ncbi:hypothetical protein [Streptomyces antibioticus]|uniref:hypothetical protein n=1 Tax=Streptomyces antibioticus TaxID=1890 RepID=UPI0036D988D6
MALATALTMSACSAGGGEEGKKYTIPDALCGVPMNHELLDAFLPGGDSLSVKASAPNGGTKRCDVTVDGDISLRQTQTWWNNGESASTVGAGYDGMDGGRPTADGRYVYSSAGAVGKTAKSCTSPDHPDQRLFAVIQVFTPDHPATGKMKKLITDYTHALEKSGECR